jgi:phenylacetate-CoA ligase
MRIVVERAEQIVAGADPDLGRTLELLIKKKLLVSPTVEVVDYGSLPRSVRKSQRVFDTRIQENEIVG